MNQPQMYESASISVFFQHGCLYFWARACLLYMHESSLLTYLHIPSVPSVFHNQRVLVTVTVSWTVVQTLILPWKTTAQQDLFFFFYFFGVAVRFDWIKIDVWVKLGVLYYSSRPKLSLGSAHVKYGVWPVPKTAVISSKLSFLSRNVYNCAWC